MADCGIIGGKYRLQRLLGSGGTAEVYLAWDIRLQKYWAVKKIRKAPGNQRMLERETELLGWLDHPALPRIVDRTEDCDAVYLVMDFIEGETLEHLLKREGPQEGVRIWEWARELAEVLDYLHTRQPPVLYRDLKPANILLQKEGRLKLVDLGIASADGRPAEGWGTRGYAAPEQLRGNPDCRSDIYCLGVTLYRMAAGKLPGRHPVKRIPGMSGKLSKILWKCMEHQKEKRFYSSRELLNSLEKCRENSFRRNRALSKRRKWALSAASILLVCAIGAVNGRLEQKEKEETYRQWIERAERTVDQEEKEKLIRQAILLRPDHMEGYLMLVESFKADESFSTEEEKLILALVEAGGSKLKEQAEYADLAFQVGKLYWYYYSYGKEEWSEAGIASDNELTRMKAAVPWFEAAVKAQGGSVQRKMAGIYREVGSFYRDLAVRVREGTEEGQYLSFWKNMNVLLNEVRQDNGLPETARLEFYRMCVRAVASYQRELLSEGVTDGELLVFRLETTEAAGAVNPSTERGRALRDEIIEEVKIIGKETFYGR